MTIPSVCLLLRVYIGKELFAGGSPVYEEIVYEAKKANLGGVTVIQAVEGFGHIGVLQSEDNPHNNDLPVLIEVIDSPEKIRNFIPVVAKLLGNHGLITTSEVHVVHQGMLLPHHGP